MPPRASLFPPTAALAALVLAAPLLPPTAAPAQPPASPPPMERAAARAATLKAALDHQPPRLTVVMSVDQLRFDYLTRFSDQFLPAATNDGTVGGFRYLMERGAHFADAHYSHIPTFTGPGHATILTGATLADSGIIANDWRTSSGLVMYCVEDANTQPVGGNLRRGGSRGGSSPNNLQAETVGDALRLSNNRASKVVGIAIKDRASILLAGHNPTAAVWFDDSTGNFITSTYYTTGTLPAFAERANRERVADRWAGKSWDYLLPDRAAYARSAPENYPGIGSPKGLPGTMPKRLAALSGDKSRDYWSAMTFTPFGNEMTLAVAEMAIADEALGARGVPDLLALNFSSDDYVGHTYGPNSPEAQDITLRLDRQLSAFFNRLRTTRPRGLDDVLFVLTADHGAAPLPEWAHDSMKYDAGRTLYGNFTAAASEALATRFPDKATSGLVTGFAEPYLYLNLPRARAIGLDLPAAREAIAERLALLEGVYATYPRERIERNQLPPSTLSTCIANGFHPDRSGDVVVLCRPFWYASTSKTGTTHGSGYNYDTQVPILFSGPNVKPGLYPQRADVRDIAPTLAAILGIQAPSSSTGRILGEMLE